MRFLIFLLFLSPLIIGIFVFDSVIVAVLFWLLCLGVFIGVRYLYTKTPTYQKKKAARKAEKAELDSLVSFDKETGVLTLHKRSPLIAKLIQIRESKDFFIKYEPEKLHVGAVTVGGVTSGGAYTTGGYNYISEEKKNGLCTLEYGTNGDRIRKIQLSPTDYIDAAQSIIADYLDSEKQQIDIIVDVRVDQWQQEQELRNFKTTGYFGNEAANRGKPTLEKGLKIMDWLTTES